MILIDQKHKQVFFNSLNKYQFQKLNIWHALFDYENNLDKASSCLLHDHQVIRKQDGDNFTLLRHCAHMLIILNEHYDKSIIKYQWRSLLCAYDDINL